GLSEQRDHAQLLQQHGVERYFVQPVKNLGRRSWWFPALDRVYFNENGVLRFALPDQGRDRGIAGIASVPVQFVIDLDRLKHGWQTCRRKQNLRRNGIVLEHVTASGPHVGRGDEKLDRR